MKRLTLFALAAAAATAAAHADPITVMAPKDPSSPEQAAAYAEQLDLAVKRVCADANAPIMGLAYYSYMACLKATKADVEKKEPTGLYAARSANTVTEIAAR